MNVAKFAADLLFLDAQYAENRFMLLMNKHMFYVRAQQMKLDSRFDKKGKTKHELSQELSQELSNLLLNYTSANHESTLSRIRIILNKGANPDKSIIKNLAARANNLEIISELLIAGMKITANDLRDIPYYKNNKEVSELISENHFNTRLYYLINKLDTMFNIKELISFNERNKSLSELYEMVSIVMQELSSVTPRDYMKLNGYLDAINNKLDIVDQFDRSIKYNDIPVYPQVLDKYYGQINHSDIEAKKANDGFKLAFQLMIKINRNNVEHYCDNFINKFNALQNTLNNLGSKTIFAEYNNKLLEIINQIKSIKADNRTDANVVMISDMLDKMIGLQDVFMDFERFLQTAHLSEEDKYQGNKILNVAAYMLDFESVGSVKKAIYKINFYSSSINDFVGLLKNSEFDNLSFVKVSWNKSENKFHVTSADAYNDNRQKIDLTYDELVKAIKTYQSKNSPEIDNKDVHQESHLLSRSLGSMISASHPAKSSVTSEYENEQKKDDESKQQYKS